MKKEKKKMSDFKISKIYRRTIMMNSFCSDSNGLYHMAKNESLFRISKTRCLIFVTEQPSSVVIVRASIFREVGSGTEVDDGFSNSLENEILRLISIRWPVFLERIWEDFCFLLFWKVTKWILSAKNFKGYILIYKGH